MDDSSIISSEILDKVDEEILANSVSDEALEAAAEAGGPTGGFSNVWPDLRCC